MFVLQHNDDSDFSEISVIKFDNEKNKTKQKKLTVPKADYDVWK